MIDNNGGGGISQNVGYSNNPSGLYRVANENSNNNGGISHHSAVSLVFAIDNSRDLIHWVVLAININR